MGGTMATEQTKHKGIELRITGDAESIRIRFMYKGMECRETLQLPHKKQNINYAVRMRGEILNAITLGTFKYSEYFPNSANAVKFGCQVSKATIGSLLREWLRTSEKNLSPSTLRGYKQVCRDHLFKQFDEVLITELKPPQLRAWIATLDSKVKTIRNILTPLRNVIEIAINDDIIQSNPLDRVKLSKILSRDALQSDFVVDPFNITEINAILAACSGQEKNIWKFAFATGMRTSEFIALKWSSIDWVGCTIPVEEVRVEGITKPYPKTDAGKRSIDMRHAAFNALKDQQAHTKLAGGLVFLDPRYDEGWADDQALKKRWTRILAKAGVRYRNPYQTRHTFASTLLSSGSNPLYVAQQMGHKGTEMIMKSYGRWIDNDGIEPTSKEQALAFFAQVSPTRKLNNG
jgi:integrase